ncbi:unnamed protein product [Anisakis simplex]|uniref:Uncharacterized protein n=1 Tax=Anisakis simplex TaxID=6269 RepID=A0A0M3KIX5_ANISI|nr:unnamed protein product [Anisakis simplex]
MSRNVDDDDENRRVVPPNSNVLTDGHGSMNRTSLSRFASWNLVVSQQIH